MVDFGKDAYITPEEVGAQLYRLYVDDKIQGGTVLEVAAGGNMRKVEAFNDPGPQGLGHTVSNAQVLVDEVYETLSRDGWGKPQEFLSNNA